MSYRGELPGLYWDEEKRKYFAVHANHHAAAPAQAKYTQSSVDQKKRDAKNRKREKQREAARRRLLVQRAPVLEHPGINNIGITAELGYGRSRRLNTINDRSQAYLRSGLAAKILLDTGLSEGEAFDEATGRTWSISHFDYDIATQGLIYGVCLGGGQIVSGVSSILPTRSSTEREHDDEDREPRVIYPLGNSKTIYAIQSQISSLHMSPTTRTLVATSPGDTQQPAVYLTRLDDAAHAIELGIMDGGITTHYRLTDTATIFCSAVNPWPSSQETVAVGTGGPGAISIFHAANDGVRSGGWSQTAGMQTHSDVLAVDWLSPSLLAAGLRNGTVALYDSRVKQGVKRMKHSGGILNLKRADADTRFVCTGMGSKMALYDLRALREEDAPPSGPKKRRTEKSKGNSQSNAPATGHDRVAKPVLTFQYDNQYDMLGMDVCAELGVVAAAENRGFVRVSSLRTGKDVAMWNVHVEPGEKVGCVRFVEDAMGAPKLMASCGSKIVELSW